MNDTEVGEIIALFVSQRGSSDRVFQSEIRVDEKGILGDKFYDKDIQRSILLTSLDSYELAYQHGIELPHGALGENILIDFNPYKLPATTVLYIGDVILQISQNCTICNHLSSFDKRLPKLLKDDRGIFAQVVQGGMIRKGDTISLSQVLS